MSKQAHAIIHAQKHDGTRIGYPIGVPSDIDPTDVRSVVEWALFANDVPNELGWSIIAETQSGDRYVYPAPEAVKDVNPHLNMDGYRNNREMCNSRRVVLATLMPLFERAIRENVWFKFQDDGPYFSPEELRQEHHNARMEWSAEFWQLVDPNNSPLADLREQRDAAQQKYEHMLERINAWACCIGVFGSLSQGEGHEREESQ